MTKPTIALPYVVAMIAVIVTVDVLIFRNDLWGCLLANIGIVLLFAAFYSRFLKARKLLRLSRLRNRVAIATHLYGFVCGLAHLIIWK